MSKTRGISFNYEFTPHYDIRSKPIDPSLESGAADININSRFIFDLKAPLFNKNYLKAAIGFKYVQEDFTIVSETPRQFDFHTALNDHSLKRLGTSLYVLKPFIGNKYLAFRGNVNFSGNYSGFTKIKNEYLSYDLSTLLGIRKNEQTEFGFGVTYRVKPGIHSIYPLLMYNHTFNERWGLEALLPLKAKLRYNLSDNTMLFGGAELRGGSYVIKSSQLHGFENQPISFNNTEIRYGATIEKKVFRFLWLAFDLGYRSNMNFDFARTTSGKKYTIIETDADGGMYANFTIFLTPPDKLKK